MGVVLLVAIIVYVLAKVISDASITSRCVDEGHRVFESQRQHFIAQNRKEAREKDYWFNPQTSMFPDSSFYSDGSVRKDCITGKTYKKGETYVHSNGRRAI